MARLKASPTSGSSTISIERDVLLRAESWMPFKKGTVTSPAGAWNVASAVASGSKGLSQAPFR